MNQVKRPPEAKATTLRGKYVRLFMRESSSVREGVRMKAPLSKEVETAQLKELFATQLSRCAATHRRSWQPVTAEVRGT